MKQLIGLILTGTILGTCTLQVGFDFLSNNSLTEPAYIAGGILLIAATLWISEAIPLFVTSVLILFLCLAWLQPAMSEAGLEIESQVFTQTFFSDIILLFLGGFTLSAAMQKLRLDEWLSQSILLRTGNSLPRLMLGILATTAVLSMWLSNTATAAMMLTLVLPIAKRLPLQQRQNLILCVPFAANIGGLGTPIGSPPNAIAMEYLRQSGAEPSFMLWLLIGVPGVIVMLLIAWLTLYALSGRTVNDLEISVQSPTLKPSRNLLVVVCTVALTVLGWMTSELHGYSSGTVALVPLLVFFATGVLVVADVRTLAWDVLLLMGGGLCLGVAIAESGLAVWILNLLPMDAIAPFWLAAGMGALACFMSSIMSNTATANLIMPIAVGLSSVESAPLLVGIAFACTLAMPLPVSTPPNAMAFSSEQLTVGSMLRPGILLTFSGLIFTFTLGFWWWSMVGL